MGYHDLEPIDIELSDDLEELRMQVNRRRAKEANPYEDDFPADDSVPLSYEPVSPRIQSLDDVIGLDELKEELRLQLQV